MNSVIIEAILFKISKQKKIEIQAQIKWDPTQNAKDKLAFPYCLVLIICTIADIFLLTRSLTLVEFLQFNILQIIASICAINGRVSLLSAKSARSAKTSARKKKEIKETVPG